MFDGSTNSLTDKYGDTFGFYIMSNPMLFVSDIELMKEINIRQFSNFSMRRKPDEGATVMGKWAKDLISIIGGHQWRRIRQSTVSKATKPFYNC